MINWKWRRSARGMRKTRDRREDYEGEKCKGVVRKAERTNTKRTHLEMCVCGQRQSWVHYFFSLFCVCVSFQPGQE